MLFKLTKNWVITVVLGGALIGNASGLSAGSPVDLYYRTMPESVAIASYRHIKIDELRKLVIGAFEASDFSFISVSKIKEDEWQYRFSYPVPANGKVDTIFLVLKVDENVDKNKRCVSCFLRRVDLPNLLEIKGLSWMAQYDTGYQVYTRIDRAFEKVRVDGQAYMDASIGFNYKNFWQKEQNLFGNSFTGVSPQDLKTLTIDAYLAAGFVFAGEKQAKLSADGSVFNFIFPLDSDQAVGVAYGVGFYSQMKKDGACHPCEVNEYFDPYQTLPAAGLTGMASRLTLESRFTAARMLAFEKLKSGTERYLRPRTEFVVPAKTVPLGSPRPSFVPIAAT